VGQVQLHVGRATHDAVQQVAILTEGFRGESDLRFVIRARQQPA
jgi:hypothetical protein